MATAVKKLYPELEVFNGKITLGEKGLQVGEIVSNGNSGWKGTKFDIRLTNPDGNSQFVRFFAGGTYKEGKLVPRESLKYKKKVDGVDKEFVIPFSNRFDEEVIKEAPMYMKRTYINGDIKKVFLDDLDWINFLIEELPTIDGKYIKCRGKVSHSITDKAVVYHEFNVNYIEVLQGTNEEIEASKKLTTSPRFTTREDLYFTRDSIDAEIFKGKDLNTKVIIEDYNKKVPVQVYTKNDNQNKATKEAIPHILVPMTIYVDMTKIDFNNPMHLAKAAMLCKMFVVKGKGVYSVGGLLKYVSGKEETELTEDQIEELLGKEQLAMLEYFPEQKKAAIEAATGRKQVGEKINEVRIYSPWGAKMVAQEDELLTVDMLDLWKIATRKEETATTTVKKETVKQEVVEDEEEDLDPESLAALF